MSAVLHIDFIWPKRLPWRKIFYDMKQRGLAYSAQAERVGVPWTTYRDWLEEKLEPRHSQAVALLELHTAICGSELSLQRQREAVLAE